MQPKYVRKKLLQRRDRQLIDKILCCFTGFCGVRGICQLFKYVICSDFFPHFRQVLTFVPNFVCVILYSLS